MTVHPTVASFSAGADELLVGGVPVSRLAARAGGTPFFAYDRSKIEARVAAVRAALPAAVELSYAIKANPMPAVVGCLASLVDGLDVASGGELRVALDTGTPSDRISLAGPGKKDWELAQAVACSVTIELESPAEVDRVLAAGERLGIRPRVAVRVNPEFQVKGSGMRMGGGPQQFGIDSELVPDVLKDIAVKDLEMLGFHVFAGSQNLHAAVIAESQSRIVELAMRLSADLPGPLRYLNLGGGFGIPYYENDSPLDLGLVGDNLGRLMDDVVRTQLPQARVVIELGRYLVGESGVYVTRVVDRKVSRGATFLVVDGGLHHQLAASGQFGQVLRRNYPLVVATRLTSPAAETATVVGCLCTPLDLLGDRVHIPQAEVGDLIAIFHAGAYGATASPAAFLGHPPAVEMLV